MTEPDGGPDDGRDGGRIDPADPRLDAVPLPPDPVSAPPTFPDWDPVPPED